MDKYIPQNEDWETVRVSLLSIRDKIKELEIGQYSESKFKGVNTVYKSTLCVFQRIRLEWKISTWEVTVIILDPQLRETAESKYHALRNWLDTRLEEAYIAAQQGDDPNDDNPDNRKFIGGIEVKEWHFLDFLQFLKSRSLLTLLEGCYFVNFVLAPW